MTLRSTFSVQATNGSPAIWGVIIADPLKSAGRSVSTCERLKDLCPRAGTLKVPVDTVVPEESAAEIWKVFVEVEMLATATPRSRVAREVYRVEGRVGGADSSSEATVLVILRNSTVPCTGTSEVTMA